MDDPISEPAQKPRANRLSWLSLGVAVLFFLLFMVIPGFGYEFAPALQIAPFLWIAALVLIVLALRSRRAPRWPAYTAIFVLVSPVVFGLGAMALMGLR